MVTTPTINLFNLFLGCIKKKGFYHLSCQQCPWSTHRCCNGTQLQEKLEYVGARGCFQRSQRGARLGITRGCCWWGITRWFPGLNFGGPNFLVHSSNTPRVFLLRVLGCPPFSYGFLMIFTKVFTQNLRSKTSAPAVLVTRWRRRRVRTTTCNCWLKQWATWSQQGRTPRWQPSAMGRFFRSFSM